MRARRFILRGSVWVEVQGASPERFLNALTQAGLRFWGAEPSDGSPLCPADRKAGASATLSSAASAVFPSSDAW